MTLKEIAGLNCDYLTPTQAAPVLKCNPYFINLMAKTEENRKALGFPVIRVGTRIKIPRIPFLRVMGWEGEIAGECTAT